MSNINRQVIKASTTLEPAILGTFSGKCIDTNVFNNNDWRASRRVFEVLMDSDEYKRAMKYRHYIGYAGHPEDSDCQDFEHACIVMTDMRLLDNGEVEGDFDLINTKVGRIIKAFIDAGVKFGISIRGLGDIGSDGEVDPDEFIFRGFDLVTFPAYNDCIPEFKAIAASTDFKKKAQYKKICASIDANLQGITSKEALTFIQEQLPENSDEFNKVQERMEELEAPIEVVEVVEEVDDSAEILSITEEKLKAMTELYLDAAANVRELEQRVVDLEICCKDYTSSLEEAVADKQELEARLEDSASKITEVVLECRTLKQKQARLNRLTASQLEDATNSSSAYEAKCARTEKQIERLRASLSTVRTELSNARTELATAKEQYSTQLAATTRLREKLKSVTELHKEDQKSLKASNDLNLKYKMKIEANSEAISQKDSAIEDLEGRLNETVIKSKEFESEASNLGDKNEELLSRAEAAEEMVSSYQQAYANLYANALGVYLTNLPIDPTTTVEELTEMIKAGTSSAGVASAPSFDVDELEDTDYIADEYIDGDSEELFNDSEVRYSAGMVTL